MQLAPRVQALFDWLVDGAPGASSPVPVIDRLCADLVAEGLPLDRFAAFVRTLHPQVAGRMFLWVPGHPVEIREAPWSWYASDAFRANPMHAVFEHGREGRQSLAGSAELDPTLEGFRKEGYSDWLALPLHFMSGHRHGVSFCTRREGGFTEAHVAVLREITRPLTRVAETLALMRSAANLLSAYVGRDAGTRVLNGQVQRGEVESIACVVWFSDLRGFTVLSDTMSPKAVIHVLNELFDAQVPAIDANGGEVLKFIGDGLLAIFPIDAKRTARSACDAALAASRQALAAVAELNAHRTGGGTPMRFGIALHLGEVAYGNIGGASRLDFTCIGSTVNVASRIEGLTGKLGHDVLLSESFATAAGIVAPPLGTYELKGVEKPQRVYLPPPASSM